MSQDYSYKTNLLGQDKNTPHTDHHEPDFSHEPVARHYSNIPDNSSNLVNRTRTGEIPEIDIEHHHSYPQIHTLEHDAHGTGQEGCDHEQTLGETPIYRKMLSPWINAHDNSVRRNSDSKDGWEVGIFIFQIPSKNT